MNLYTLSDEGPAIYDAETDTAYERVSTTPSPGLPNWSPGTYDVTHIGGVSFQFHGPDGTSESWDPDEVAVATQVSANHQTYTCPDDPGDRAPHIWTMPYTGELRAIAPNYTGGTDLRVCGVNMDAILMVRESDAAWRLETSRPAIVLKGRPLYLRDKDHDYLLDRDAGVHVKLFCRPARWPQ